MKLYCVRAFITVKLCSPVHMPVCMPIYGPPLSRRILSAFQSVYRVNSKYEVYMQCACGEHRVIRSSLFDLFPSLLHDFKNSPSLVRNWLKIQIEEW